MSKYLIFFTFCLLKNSLSFRCWSAQCQHWRFLFTGFFFLKWLLDRKTILRKYHLLIMMGFVLQYYHHAAGEILSQHVPHLLLFETLSEHVECKIPSCFFYVTSDSYHYLRWLLFLRCRDPCNKKREKRDHLRLYLLLQWYV